MKASLTNWAAAGLILAAGSAVFGATGAAAGLRPPVPAHPAVSASRLGEPHAIERGRRRVERNRRNGLDESGALGPTEGEPPAEEEQEPPQAAAFCPPAPELGRAVARSGPRIIEIGAGAARRGPWPVVVYGDFSP
ncbi:MAG: hypothetical protein ACLPSW_10585 [Roseiarcus sp.]